MGVIVALNGSVIDWTKHVPSIGASVLNSVGNSAAEDLDGIFLLYVLLFCEIAGMEPQMMFNKVSDKVVAVIIALVKVQL